jgi:hypothetical protein
VDIYLLQESIQIQPTEKMSIARALTKRYKANLVEEPLQSPTHRIGSIKRLDKPIDRSKISLPIELLSSTNALAYEAPDIYPTNPVSPLSASSASSRRSYEDSESGASSATSITSPTLSREPSPTVSEPNHLTSYFQANSMKPGSVATPPTPMSPVFNEVEIPPTTPAVPTRALSHTKKTHQALARKRSQTRLSNEINASQAPRVARSSLDLLSNNTEPDHPFEAELAQVKEVAEEFGVKDVRIWDEEEQFLIDRGFGRFTAEDYFNEIEPLFSKAFYDTPIVTNPVWL